MKKRSIINAICVVLAIILITCSGGMFYNVFRAYLVLDTDVLIDNDFAKSIPIEKTQPFKHEIFIDIYSLSRDTEGRYLSEEFEKYSESIKREIVEEFSKEYLRQRAYFIENYFINSLRTVDYAYPEDYFRTDTNYSVPEKAIRNKVTFDKDAPGLIRDIQTIVNGTKGLKFNDYALLVPYEELESRHFEYSKEFNFGNNIYDFSIDDFLLLEDDISDEVSQRFDYFTAELYEEYDYYSYNQNHYQAKDSFKYYVKNTKTGEITTNLEDENYEDLTEKPIFYVNNKGKEKTSKNTEYLLEDEVFSTDDFVCYVAIDVENAKTPDFYTVYDAYYTNLQQSGINDDLVFGFVFLVLAIILSIIVLTKTKRERIFIDKLFSDVHLFFVFVVVDLVICGLIFIYDNNNYLIFGENSQYLVAFGCGLGFALIIEFLCSITRTCKSGKKIYENCLIFVVLKFVFKSVAKVINKIKQTLSYQPAKLHKTIIISIALALLVDAVLGALLIGFCVSGIPVFVVLTSIALAIFNIFLAVIWIKYLINLDKIITSAVNRTELEDLEKLPVSLKTLQESMKYTNDELKKAVEKAVRDERLKTELITNVSHDLKTPLTSIINYVDLLDKCDIKDKRAKEYIKILDEKGLKLKRLIDDLIEASKVSSGNINLNLSQINLSELVVQAVSETEEDFKKAKLEIKCKLSENQPIILADGNKTFRVVENLLSNAKKYSAKSTRVYIEVYEEGSFGVFEIKNISETPLDISPEELTERFVRGDKSRTNEGNGLG
ncbi:MAG: HAMP domain-containing histidine kinase, partial [Clostridia bacterium]|nr:HAMP domain-containing histidine kinase [Clostridia bacterium]